MVDMPLLKMKKQQYLTQQYLTCKKNMIGKSIWIVSGEKGKAHYYAYIKFNSHLTFDMPVFIFNNVYSMAFTGCLSNGTSMKNNQFHSQKLKC